MVLWPNQGFSIPEQPRFRATAWVAGGMAVILESVKAL